MSAVIVDVFGKPKFSEMEDAELKANWKAFRALSDGKDELPEEYHMQIYANHRNADDEMKSRGLK